MPPPRRNKAEEPTTRTALLDATEQIMLNKGYAAVTSRSVGMSVGVDPALVFYYFGTMDDLFIALFERRVKRTLERHEQVLASSQPLWGLWDACRDRFDAALLMEFHALANHRKAVRTEIIAYSKKFRDLQTNALTGVLAGYGIDPRDLSPACLILIISGISCFLLNEEAFGITLGHEETVEIVERYIREIEGERKGTTTQISSGGDSHG